jgi:hypothetical protein|tara:strand:+ start:3476 stop:3637 length:162 start_codon:yes stop_codon:yes gene_type:complete
MIARVLISLEIDEDDYPVPVDGSVEQELNEALYAYIYDIDGITITKMRITTDE